jgi:hypothetical protein
MKISLFELHFSKYYIGFEILNIDPTKGIDRSLLSFTYEPDDRKIWIGIIFLYLRFYI